MNSFTPKHSVSVAAAIINNAGRVLATRRRDNGQWEPPGGVLELDEAIEDGVVREVLEETGLLVRPVQLSGVYKNMVRGIVALVFRCEVVEQEATVSDEVDEVRWLGPVEIAERMEEAYAVRMLDALDDGRPSVRATDAPSCIPDVFGIATCCLHATSSAANQRQGHRLPLSMQTDTAASISSAMRALGGLGHGRLVAAARVALWR